MSKEKSAEIRTYLKSGSGGTFYGCDSNDVIMRALKHSKIADCSGEDFATTLRIYGITPDVVRGAYRLVLPTASR
jgi:hypothetical protein